MRVLVTWGSKGGGTEGIGRMIGQALTDAGLDVVALRANEVKRIDAFGFDLTPAMVAEAEV